MRILDGILEPDTLGKILLAVGAGLGEDGQKERARDLLVHLKTTSRWRMNVAMLDPKEMRAGREAWAACGAEGVWP